MNQGGDCDSLMIIGVLDGVCVRVNSVFVDLPVSFPPYLETHKFLLQLNCPLN